MARQWNVGIVGARGLSTMLGFSAIENVEVRALCDLNGDLLARQSARHNIPKTYRVYQDMLADDVDIVVVATPMQLHAEQALAALEAGKHVLSEVTAAVSMDELWWLIEAVEKFGKTYMMAENCCYKPENQLVRRMVEAGLFGEVYFGEGEYLHEIAGLATYPDGKTSWRSFWQLGKRGNFYPTHSLGPVMQWFGNDRIVSVSCFGTRGHAVPELRQDDTTITLVTLESGKLIKLRLDCLSPRPHNPSYYSLQGTLGCYEAPRGLGDDHKVWLKGMDANTDAAKWRPLHDFSDYLPERYRAATEAQKEAGHWGGDFFIVRDFMDAVEGGVRPAIDIYDVCEWTAVALLSELSVMNGGRAMEMPDFRRARHKDQQLTRL